MKKVHNLFPANIFKHCTVLNSIESFFSGIDINNNGKVYEFPPAGMFDDCVALQNIRRLFSGCNNLKLKLVGEGFKNCALSDVCLMRLRIVEYLE